MTFGENWGWGASSVLTLMRFTHFLFIQFWCLHR
jgi:hypothetical protein